MEVLTFLKTFSYVLFKSLIFSFISGTSEINKGPPKALFEDLIDMKTKKKIRLMVLKRDYELLNLF